MQARTLSLLRSLFFLGVVFAAVTLIVYMKRSTDQPLTPEQAARRNSLRHIATPDTNLTPELQVEERTATPSSTRLTPEESDSLDTSMDLRSPSDAGYEDGYFAGLEDGIAQRERFSYDESSQFPTSAQRRNYAEGYRRGYHQGFHDGQHGSPMPEAPSEE